MSTRDRVSGENRNVLAIRIASVVGVVLLVVAGIYFLSGREAPTTSSDEKPPEERSVAEKKGFYRPDGHELRVREWKSLGDRLAALKAEPDKAVGHFKKVVTEDARVHRACAHDSLWDRWLAAKEELKPLDADRLRASEDLVSLLKKELKVDVTDADVFYDNVDRMERRLQSLRDNLAKLESLLTDKIGFIDRLVVDARALPETELPNETAVERRFREIDEERGREARHRFDTVERLAEAQSLFSWHTYLAPSPDKKGEKTWREDIAAGCYYGGIDVWWLTLKWWSDDKPPVQFNTPECGRRYREFLLLVDTHGLNNLCVPFHGWEKHISKESIGNYWGDGKGPYYSDGRSRYARSLWWRMKRHPLTRRGKKHPSHPDYKTLYREEE